MGESPKNQPEQNEAERMKKEMREKLDKTKRIHDTLIAHFNKAFAEGKLIVDKSDPDAKVKVDNQRGEVYTAIFEELEQHGIRFKKPPGTIREMRDYLRSQGYVYIGGTLNIQHPTKKDVILHIFSPTLFKVESSERVSLANYLAGYLKFEEGSTVEVIHTSRNLIEGERNVLEERHGVISRMHGTTERIPGGAAILLRDNIREEAEWKQKKEMER